MDQPVRPGLFPSSSFQISGGANGGACPSLPLPFSPSLIAGSTTDQAGGYTDFSLLLQRGDDQQRIERLQFKAPAGLSGMIAPSRNAPNRRRPKANAPTASKIGHATVASGPGPYPLVIPQPGNPESPIYITGPYEGAPFGLSIVTHVIAGPFNLGTTSHGQDRNRSAHRADHGHDRAAATDRRRRPDRPAPDRLGGRPRRLHVNPTNCMASSFSGTASGTPPPGGAARARSAPIASRFQVGSCQSLKFKPTLRLDLGAKPRAWTAPACT